MLLIKSYCVAIGHPALSSVSLPSQGIYAYVTLQEELEMTDDLRKELVMAVRDEIGGCCRTVCLTCGFSLSLFLSCRAHSKQHGFY